MSVSMKPELDFESLIVRPEYCDCGAELIDPYVDKCPYCLRFSSKPRIFKVREKKRPNGTFKGHRVETEKWR